MCVYITCFDVKVLTCTVQNLTLLLINFCILELFSWRCSWGLKKVVGHAGGQLRMKFLHQKRVMWADSNCSAFHFTHGSTLGWSILFSFTVLVKHC